MFEIFRAGHLEGQAIIHRDRVKLLSTGRIFLSQGSLSLAYKAFELTESGTHRLSKVISLS